MLANFASPWNCIYSAAKLSQDPQFPKTHILGSGALVFVEHVKGQYWRGKRFDRYLTPASLISTAFRPISSPAPRSSRPATKGGRIAASSVA